MRHRHGHAEGHPTDISTGSLGRSRSNNQYHRCTAKVGEVLERESYKTVAARLRGASNSSTRARTFVRSAALATGNISRRGTVGRGSTLTRNEISSERPRRGVEREGVELPWFDNPKFRFESSETRSEPSEYHLTHKSQRKDSRSSQHRGIDTTPQ